jgi:adenylylsulfate kinase-like enzyme
MIYVLYGQPASGKTTLGKLLATDLQTPFVIDGDEFRGMFSNGNYGKGGREENIKNANAVATYLNKKGEQEDWVAVYFRENENNIQGRPVKRETDVVMCLVNPYEHLREELRNNNENKVVEVFLKSDRDLRKDYHVKGFEIGNPEYVISTDQEVEETWFKLKSLLETPQKR